MSDLDPNAVMAAHPQSSWLGRCGACVPADLVPWPCEPYRMAEALAIAERLLSELVDPDPCWFDHNGGCQAHGFISLQPGETCPHSDVKKLLGL